MSQLNPAQRAAVTHAQGPLLILAGAGTGKTRVIAHRIAHLVSQGTRPESILAVSFTHKAAGEMGHRVSALVGRQAAERLWLSTFHSFGVRFLTEEAKTLGHQGRFVIYDQGDSLGLVRELARRPAGAPRLDASALLARISLWKNAFLSPSDIPPSDDAYDETAQRLYPEYEQALRGMRAYDFDDLVVVPARLLRDHPEVRERWQARFRHVLIDEFQDTNPSQFELARQLTNALGNLCVVGDDDQSIYGFRGADVSNIREFEDHFPQAQVVKLEENYRSRAPILAVANAAIAQSPHRRHDKRLRSARGPGESVRLVAIPDAEQEAKFVAREIADLVRQEGTPLGEIAVLYRSNLQARPVEEELRISDIPYRMFGGTQLFDRKEVKDAAAYLRLVLNPRDELSLRRVLNVPPRGVGSTTVTRLDKLAQQRGIMFPTAVSKATAFDDIPSAAKRGIEDFLGYVETARRAIEGGSSVASAAQSLFEQCGLKRYLLDDGAAGARRWDNVYSLVRSIERFEVRDGRSRAALARYLQQAFLRADGDASDRSDQVTLATLHAAKGLEFSTVFLIGCVEGRLPHHRVTDPKITEAVAGDVEEERRLFYVGVTRAKDRLYLTRPQRKMLRGTVRPLTPSRFLDGLPSESAETYERKDEGPLETAATADLARSLLAELRG